MPKMRHFAVREGSHAGSFKHAHVKRKAPKQESRNSTEESPSKVPRKKLPVSDNTLQEHPTPGKFMKLKEVFDSIKTAEKVLDSVPEGEKCNVFCVIEDSKNALRRAENLTVAYEDGCKLSSNKGNNGTIYIQFMEGRILHIRLKDELFHRPKYIQNQIHWEPIKPQPDANSLVKVCRYYSEIPGNIKRRVTAVSGEDYKDRALVEYVYMTTPQIRRSKHPNTLNARGKALTEDCGMSNKNTGHKNTAAQKYTCLKPEVSIKKKKDDIGPIDKENDKQEASRNIKKTSNSNIKKTSNTNIKMQREMLTRGVQDEDLVLIAMLEENPLVQAVINRKDKSPSVILYNDKQLSEMKRNLEFGSVLGIDCTYKVGDCFITMTVYQNSRALHKTTNEPLLYLGPVFLHADEDFLTYMSFFSHIMDKLEDTELNFEVKLGYDLELSLLKALKHSFPASVQVVNTQHLKTLVYKHLIDITHTKPKTSSAISQKIFGPKGIISSPSLSVFQDRMMELQEYFDEFSSLKKYFDRLEPFLYPYICEPVQRGVSQKLWANGNDEVLNGLLRTFLRNELHQMSDIVESIGTITGLQIMKLDNA